MNNPLQAFDKALLDVFNKDIKNPIFDFLFPLITRLGEVVVVLPLCLLVFILDKKKGKRATTLLVVAYLLSRLVALILKVITNRPRPYLAYPDLQVLGDATLSSFPSGHAILVTALAFVLGNKYEDWQWWLWIVVVLVGISRMYMGLHYPTDVAAGIIIGLAIGYFTTSLERAYEKYKSGGMGK